MVSYPETSMAHMYDYVIRANFTTTSGLKEKLFAFAFVVLGCSIKLYCLGNLFIKNFATFNFKTRLGAEICSSGVNIQDQFRLVGKLPTYPSPTLTFCPR